VARSKEVCRTTTDGVRSSLLQFMHEGGAMVITLAGRSVVAKTLSPASIKGARDESQPRPRRLSMEARPDVAGRVIYQLPIDGLLDSWAGTTMPVMRTSQ
jgi:hypothetical protein